MASEASRDTAVPTEDRIDLHRQRRKHRAELSIGFGEEQRLVHVQLRDEILTSSQHRCGSATREPTVTLYFVHRIDVLVGRSRSKAHWLVRAIKEVSCHALGSAEELPLDSCCVVALDAQRRVIGLCCATQVSQAFRLVSSKSDSFVLNNVTGSAEVLRQWASEIHELDEMPDNQVAYCGVLLVWCALPYRAMGIASDMVDVARTRLVYGHEFSRSQCAFSKPTGDGKIFAARYTGRCDFLAFL